MGHSTNYRRVFLITIMLFLIAAPYGWAQDNLLHRFEGGQMDLSFFSHSQLLTGPGVSSVVVGGTAPAIDDPFTVFRNPAGMRYMQDKPYVGFTFKPTIGVQWPDQVQDQVNETMDTSIESFERTGVFEYPEISGGAYQRGSILSSVAMTFPKFPWQFGFGYSRPYYFNLDFIYGGLTEHIEAASGNPDDPSVQTIMQVKMDIDLMVKSDLWTVAVARDIGPMFTGGLSISRNYMSIESNSGMLVNGSMIFSGRMYSFNDNSDPWYNNLGGTAAGRYDGGSMIYRLGGQFVPFAEDGWRFGADLKIQPDAVLEGNMILHIDEFPALKIQTKEGEDNFDTDRIEDVSELTKTYPNSYLPSNEMKIYT
ncbi:hypothetical protein K8I28_00845, partial [bacterium]|nr:hypothetical protein [bacterium]